MKKTAILKNSRPPAKMRLLKPTGLMLLLFLLFSITSIAQNITIKGRVLKEDGTPVSGASVTIKGTGNGTASNDQGEFQLSAPGNATLVISSVDFVTQEIKVNNRTSVDVKLVSLDKSLGEVIVVGYGTQRKEAVTGSVASISGNKIREVPAPNISQALQGRLAGVEMSQTSTRPGAIMQIRIRGARSLSADNNPLIVLDGIPFLGSLNDYNPNDIASVEVLKDASATAIYGSRGANGVILITTKKGSAGKVSVNYTGSVSIDSYKNLTDWMSGGEYFDRWRLALMNGRLYQTTTNTNLNDP